MENNVIFLGCTQGYGYNFSACNTKVGFMASGLRLCGDTCIIHNGTSGKPGLKSPEYIKTEDGLEVINYPYFRNWLWSSFANYRRLVSDLKSLYNQASNNIVVLEAPYLPIYWMYMLAARRASYKVVVIAHEWLSTFKHKKIIPRLLNRLYSKLFGYGVDAILPISEYIITRIKHFRKPYFKVPIEADFSQRPEYTDRQPFFLYCVSSEYIRVISMILEAYKSYVSNGGKYGLTLVLSGNEQSRAKVNDIISELMLSANICIKSGLPYNELWTLFNHSSGLIIPLNPDYEQDKARFSQKIAEYLSSGTPIISNDVGEVHTYFKDKENIILCPYSSDGFSSSFTWIEEHRSEAHQIGYNGYGLGRDNFDFRNCGQQLHNFLTEL